MQIDHAVLQTVHRMLRQVRDLKEQLARCPKIERAAEAIQAVSDRAVQDAKQQWTETKKLADDKQLQLRQREARIETLIGRRNAADNNKEFQLLNDQIAADKQANSVLSDEILELLERIDQIDINIKETRAKLEVAKGETAKVRANVKQRADVLNAELTRITGELAIEEKKLPTELLAEYRRLVQAVGESALAETDGETCGNCFQIFNTQTYGNLRQCKFVQCRSCNAIMYFSEKITAAQANA